MTRAVIRQNDSRVTLLAIDLPAFSTSRFTFAPESQPLAGYTLGRGLGIGGFGEVYEAVSDAGKEVALKLIRRNPDAELRGVVQCLNLRHPNLISIHDIRCDEQGQPWVVMELVRGETLRDTLNRYPQGMPPAEIKKWLPGLVAGLSYLHGQGIVHRDLKPANLFLDGETVKIGDYGLAKFIAANCRTGHTGSIGTCHYMAPEIGRGCYGRDIDLYALGVIVYEMLTGRPPFDGESTQEVLFKHLTALPDLSILPAEYRQVIGRVLEKMPARRPASVEAFLAELPLEIGGEARRPAVAEEAAKPSAPWRANWTTAAVMLGILLLAGAAVLVGDGLKSGASLVAIAALAFAGGTILGNPIFTQQFGSRANEESDAAATSLIPVVARAVETTGPDSATVVARVRIASW